MARRDRDGPEMPHWHYDCRIEAELPENRVVGIRFLTTTGFVLTAAISFLVATWLLYRDVTLSYQITDWYQRISDARVQMRDIDEMRAEYDADCSRIEAAVDAMKRPYVVSSFLATLGHLLPEGMEVDDIESRDSGVVVRGIMKQSTEVASKTLGGFVKTLNADPEMSRLFSPIRLTSLTRRDDDNVIVYRITFLPKS